MMADIEKRLDFLTEMLERLAASFRHPYRGKAVKSEYYSTDIDGARMAVLSKAGMRSPELWLGGGNVRAAQVESRRDFMTLTLRFIMASDGRGDPTGEFVRMFEWIRLRARSDTSLGGMAINVRVENADSAMIGKAVIASGRITVRYEGPGF